MQELQLRQIIGEMDEGAFEQSSASLKSEIQEKGGVLESLQKEREALTTSLDRWLDLAREADQSTGAEGEKPAPVVDEGSEVEVMEDEASGQHVTKGAIAEDVSPVFAEPAARPEEGEVAAIEAMETPAEEAEAAEVDLSLVGEGGGAPEAGEAIDLSPEGPAAVAVDNRRALLLYQEGTPEEQIYPFTGDTLTIGRGRDNDIQIKNDSKVSRYHCKLFRRGGNFYIEDNKSSNGTLVGGELITEHRLLGGEEIIIGETFFRFRIMD